MSRRNALFSKSMALLEADGVETSEARELVRQALKERQGRRRKGVFVFHSLYNLSMVLNVDFKQG